MFNHCVPGACGNEDNVTPVRELIELFLSTCKDMSGLPKFPVQPHRQLLLRLESHNKEYSRTTAQRKAPNPPIQDENVPPVNYQQPVISRRSKAKHQRRVLGALSANIQDCREIEARPVEEKEDEKSSSTPYPSTSAAKSSILATFSAHILLQCLDGLYSKEAHQYLEFREQFLGTHPSPVVLVKIDLWGKVSHRVSREEYFDFLHLLLNITIEKSKINGTPTIDGSSLLISTNVAVPFLVIPGALVTDQIIDTVYQFLFLQKRPNDFKAQSALIELYYSRMLQSLFARLARIQRLPFFSDKKKAIDLTSSESLSLREMGQMFSNLFACSCCMNDGLCRSVTLSCWHWFFSVREDCQSVFTIFGMVRPQVRDHFSFPQCFTRDTPSDDDPCFCNGIHQFPEESSPPETHDCRHGDFSSEGSAAELFTKITHSLLNSNERICSGGCVAKMPPHHSHLLRYGPDPKIGSVSVDDLVNHTVDNLYDPLLRILCRRCVSLGEDDTRARRIFGSNLDGGGSLHSYTLSDCRISLVVTLRRY